MPLLISTIVLIAACHDNTTGTKPATPTGPTVYVCDALNSTTAINTNISLSDLAKYKAKGDYITSLIVDKASTPGDGIHFKTITDALAAARATRVAKNETQTAGCRITISVASGTYTGSTASSTDPSIEQLPLVIDVPMISIVGAFKMAVDAQGRATGAGTDTGATIIVPVPALKVVGTGPTSVSEEIFVVNGQVNGSKAVDDVIEGFVMRSGHAATDVSTGGQGVFSMRAQNLTVRGNKFEGNFTERIDLRASSALVERNHTSGLGASCTICAAGPGAFTVKDNRIMEGGGIDGILGLPLTGLGIPSIIEPFTLPDAAAVSVTVVNNEVRGKEAAPMGVGIRFAAMGSQAPNTSGSTVATVTGNSIVNARFGVMVEAGFPVATGALRGDIDFTSSGNTVSGSCQIDFYIALTRHATGVGVNNNFPFLKNSTYKLTLGGDLNFANAWYVHPTGFNNTLIVNGATIPNGQKQSYDAAKLCSATTGADTTTKIVEKVSTGDSGDGQTGVVSTLLAKPLRVLVRTGTTPRVGTTVSWTTTTGTLSSATSVTDATGIATVNWTLGSSAGNQTATASVAGQTSAATFTATATVFPTDAASAAALTAVLSGNAQTILAAPALVPPGAPLAPFVESRLYAISNVAMHDALNAIVPRYQRYADTGPIDNSANLAVAVLTAAHDAIVGAAPAALAATDAWYNSAMASRAGEAGIPNGVTIGRRAAAAILAKRANDKTSDGGVAPYTPGTNPGDYQFTLPFNTPDFDLFGTGGFADASKWGTNVTPFVVTSTSQFRSAAPYGASSNANAVLTAQYTADYNEVAILGCTGCDARTAVQTEIGQFWLENSPTGWNRIARTVSDQHHQNAWDSARLFALLQMGEFDSYSTNLESKYFYNFWRPVTAVALAATDGNAATTTVANWQELGFPTPPVPDYPSAHSAAGGTAAAIMEVLMPTSTGNFSTTSGSLPNVTRTFATVADAANENALSRIYV
ncbi:MAG: vanadium-dependent haloperoxidase, partial [Gemmatimonadaceae bacterium]